MVALAVLVAFIAILAVVCVVTWYVEEGQRKVRRADDTAYREGLEAALRIQGVAQDLQQQIYAEAMRHAADPHRPSGEQEQP